MPAVEVGVALPVRESAMLGHRDASPLTDKAKQVEELGYDSVWVGDSFVARHRLEPLTLLAAITMVTERVSVGTAALTASLRDPLALAHTVATLDQLAVGRLRLGLGVGAPLPVAEEHAAVTMSYRERVDRVDEAVRLWKRSWRGERGELVGRYADLTGLRDQSPPFTPGGPPVWMASNGKPGAVARAGALYDGWLPVRIDPDEYHRSWQDIRAAATAAGRDPDTITPALYVTAFIDEDDDAARAGLEAYTHRYNNLPLAPMTDYQLYFGGSAARFTRWLGEYVDAGARHVVLRMGSFDDYDHHVRVIADEVVPALHESVPV
ncbi:MULTISPECIES: LLM class flavin-dependent oxidoreductase [unclassified Saccharothrix]|uniref:LLM class flavin-dependent oxidoreductase n=1 Tax=unclassified Saccharothrix TaxID=2593673 RepID=UPI00307EF832